MAANYSLPATSQQLKKVQFLHLPAEVRQAIYHYALPKTCPDIKLLMEMGAREHCTCSPGEEKDLPLRPSSLSLANTCRQIYREFSPIYYSQVHFLLETGYIIEHFVADMQLFHIQTIRKLKLDVNTELRRDIYLRVHIDRDCSGSVPHDDLDLALSPLKHFHGLEKLRLAFLSEPRLLFQDFIERIVAHVGGAKQLKSIAISSYPGDGYWQGYRHHKLDHDAIPGWSYSSKFQERFDQDLKRIGGS